jgi:RimJ/RimL family protein N-acetyltransferase
VQPADPRNCEDWRVTRTLAELDWPVATARLAIRPAVAGDAATVWPWYRNPAVTEWMLAAPDDEERFVADYAERLPRSLVALLDGRIVATAKVAVQDAWAQREIAELARDQEAEVGWVVDPAVHGRGIGTEVAGALLAIAFDGLGVRRVIAQCFADNIASWRIMERVGMRREGAYLRESLHRSGRWLDGMTYALLAEEWEAAR